jgi:hypothetical protein
VSSEKVIEKAQVSITCVPWVLMILMLEPRGRWVAVPWRAGMVWRGKVEVAMAAVRLIGGENGL